jgi:hypothetical protein
MVKVNNAACATVSHSSARAVKPIGANTLVAAPRASLGLCRDEY